MTINITKVALLTTLLAAAGPSLAQDPAQAPESGQKTDDASTKSQGATQGQGATKDQPATKDQAGTKDQPATKDEVRTLAEELRRLKLEIGLRDVEYQSFGGMGPAASKVYFAPKGLSIGGYGELNYVNSLQGAAGDGTDLHRLVLYVGYRFNDWIVLNSEVEFEHAGKEISVEFAYLDFLLSDPVRLRVGNVLVPMGFLNEMHEPAFFNGVFRPDVETVIIPTTWNENGVGLHGQLGGLRYKAYLLAGLDVLRGAPPEKPLDEPVSAGEWLSRARTGAAEARAATAAGILSLEYAAGPATVGAAVYRGRADQRRLSGVKADVTLAEAHAQVAWRGAVARVLGTVGTLGDAGAISQALELGAQPLGSRVLGGYGELAYDVLTLVRPGGEQSLSPFVRVERYDLHAKVPAGFARDPALNRTVVTAGLTYKPITTVVLKADYQRRDSKAGDASDQVNLGAGFVF